MPRPAWSANNWRASLGSAAAAVGGVTSFVLISRGFELSFSLCALGGCSEPKNAPLGNVLQLAGVGCLILTLIASVRLSDIPLRLARALLALPLVGVVGLWLVALSVPDRGTWGQNVSLLVLVVSFTGVLVPPRVPGWWLAAGAAGAMLAGVLGESVWVGVIAGTAVFLAGIVGIEALVSSQPRSAAR